MEKESKWLIANKALEKKELRCISTHISPPAVRLEVGKQCERQLLLEAVRKKLQRESVLTGRRSLIVIDEVHYMFGQKKST